MKAGNTLVSVIVPVYNSEKYLLDFLNAISKCNFIDGDEVILVDNGSSDKSIAIIHEFLHKNERAGLFRCMEYSELAGSYAARNFGVRNAKNELLVFTDSDTKPDICWIEALRSRAADGMVLAGKIVIEIINPSNLWENFDYLAHLRSKHNAADNCVATANMAVLKNDFLKVGFFEHRFSGGDYEWSQRAAKSMKILFCGNATVFHPSRKGFGAIFLKEKRIAYGVGNHYRNKKKCVYKLIFLYFFRIFKIDTNFKYSQRLKRRGIALYDICKFNLSFLVIRFGQLIYALLGYCGADPRKLKLK